MKYLFILTIPVVTGVCGCKKPPAASADIIYKGVVLHNVCCQDVIQTVGADLLGQENWVDSNVTPVMLTYHHVFKVANPCQFGSHSVGDTIQFKIVAQQTQNCACCMMFCYTPATSNPIQVVN